MKFGLIEVIAIIMMAASLTFILTYKNIQGVECGCDLVKNIVINLSQ